MLRCKWISQRTILATIKTRIQSAHWSNPQIALFTAMVWYGKDTWNSYVVVSDNISHDRYCVDTFLRAILSNHGEKNPLFKYLRVLSDGAASQFKHKYNFANITPLKDDFNLKSLKRTFFFASSHGKGAVDGIGAVAKLHVWNNVRSQKTLLRNATSMNSAKISLFLLFLCH